MFGCNLCGGPPTPRPPNSVGAQRQIGALGKKKMKGGEGREGGGGHWEERGGEGGSHVKERGEEGPKRAGWVLHEMHSVHSNPIHATHNAQCTILIRAGTMCLVNQSMNNQRIKASSSNQGRRQTPCRWCESEGARDLFLHKKRNVSFYNTCSLPPAMVDGQRLQRKHGELTD